MQFVRDHDKAHGRGGQAAAAKKFGKSVMTISTWLKAGAKPAPQKKVVADKVAPPENKKPAVGGGVTETLQRMVVIQEEIEGLEAQFEDLKRAI